MMEILKENYLMAIMPSDFKKIVVIFSALMIWYSGVCQTQDKKSLIIVYCVKEKEGVTDSVKAQITKMIKDHLDLMHLNLSKFKIAIQYIPNSESQEKLYSAKLAINEISKLASNLGIKRQKKEYLDYNPKMYETGDCTEVEIIIFLDH